MITPHGEDPIPLMPVPLEPIAQCKTSLQLAILTQDIARRRQLTLNLEDALAVIHECAEPHVRHCKPLCIIRLLRRHGGIHVREDAKDDVGVEVEHDGGGDRKGVERFCGETGREPALAVEGREPRWVRQVSFQYAERIRMRRRSEKGKRSHIVHGGQGQLTVVAEPGNDVGEGGKLQFDEGPPSTSAKAKTDSYVPEGWP